jgi:lysyl endopeptidase
MRRTVGLLVGLCALVAISGVAVAGDPGPAVQGRVARPASTPERIGTVEQVSRALERRGRLGGGPREMTFHHPGASYVKVHFSRLFLLPGDRVTVADPSRRESYTYPLNELDDGWATSVTGDTAVVTLEPGGLDPLGLRNRLAGLGITVDKVARGFTAAEMDRAPGRRGREESVCGTDDKRDAVCYKSENPVAYQKSRAVARMLINGVELCTAWRVGPYNRMFTNHHCAGSDYEIRHSELWFNYECATCGGFEVLRATKVRGDRLLAADSTLDFSLFSVRDFQTVTKFGYLEIDPRQPARGEQMYIAQHPGGRPTMLAMNDPGERGGNCAVDDPAYHGYAEATDVSYYCDTEGGSSGSPVLTRDTHRVIALHHFGGCPNSGVRMDLIYQRVAGLL